MLFEKEIGKEWEAIYLFKWRFFLTQRAIYRTFYERL